MTDSHPVIERYLARLGEGLGSLAPDDRAEIVQEIRHHIADAVAAGKPLDGVLESLGSADTLARAYAVELLLHPRPDRRTSRVERFFKIAGLVVIGSIPTIVIVATLGSIGISFVISGVAVFVVGILESVHVHLPGVQMAGLPPIFVIILGPAMFVAGVLALWGLTAYVRLLARAIRAVLPTRTSP